MATTYSYEKKQQIKLFLSKSFLTDKLNQKIASNMSSQIGLINLFCYPYYHKVASYKIFIFVSPSLPVSYEQAISFSRWQLYNTLFWVVLQNPTHYYTVNTSSTLPRKYDTFSAI